MFAGPGLILSSERGSNTGPLPALPKRTHSRMVQIGPAAGMIVLFLGSMAGHASISLSCVTSPDSSCCAYFLVPAIETRPSAFLSSAVG